jgi:hypothetical protein
MSLAWLESLAARRAINDEIDQLLAGKLPRQVRKTTGEIAGLILREQIAKSNQPSAFDTPVNVGQF